VLDQELPLWAPIPALRRDAAVALEQASAVTGLAGFELKRVIAPERVASVDNRNWEIGGPDITRLSQSRAVALDMESAAIAANGSASACPTAHCCACPTKPLHGEIKLAGMAERVIPASCVGQHLEIGLRALGEAKPRTGNGCIRASSEASPMVAFQ